MSQPLSLLALRCANLLVAGLLTGLLTSSLSGCKTGATQTQTIVFVNAEPDVRAATVQLHLRVDGGETDGAAYFEQTRAPHWPEKLAIAPKGGDARRLYTVTAEALDGDGHVIAFARLASGFVQGEKRFVILLIEDACRNVANCSQDQTCHEGVCVVARIKPLDLGSSRDKPPSSDELVTGNAADAGPDLDAGHDAAMRVDATARNDAGTRSDAGSADSGTPANDATTPMLDTGVMPMPDTGTSAPDTGAPMLEGGTPGQDAELPRDDGQGCDQDSQCTSHKCSDGFCCKTACADACMACNVSGSEGTCTPVPAGNEPVATHPSCNQDPQASCLHDGSCDGAGLCRNWGTQTICKPSECASASNSFTGAGNCDGNGNCITPVSTSCAPYTCKSDGTACYPSCSVGGTECSSGNSCSAGSCGLKGTGSVCGQNTECMSNKCIDSTCCATDCAGQCQACNVAPNLGTCTTLSSGPPRGSRTACTGGTSACAGSCGGMPNACTYPTNACRSKSCATNAGGASVTQAASCNGAGACPTMMTMTCPAPPAHGHAGCSGSSCSIVCDPYYGLSGSTCVPVWTAETSGVTGSLLGIWGSAANDVYVVGGGSTILHSTGNGTWTKQTVSGTHDFTSVWGDKDTPSHVVAVGDIGTLFRTTNGGTQWTQENSPTGLGNFRAVSGADDLLVLALGNRVAVREGSTPPWHELTQTTTRYYSCAASIGFGYYVYAGSYDGKIYYTSTSSGDLDTVAYAPANWSSVGGIWYAAGGGLWAAGAASSGQNRIAHNDGTNGWALQNAATSQNLNAITGLTDSGGNVVLYYAVGDVGTIVSSTGNGSWSVKTSSTTQTLYAVWGSSNNDVYAVGGNGTILHLKGP